MLPVPTCYLFLPVKFLSHLLPRNLFFCCRECDIIKKNKQLFALCFYRQSRALEHCQQMLRMSTAGLQGYCPICLLPCIATKHAACQDHVLHSRDKLSLLHSQHCQECNRIAEQSYGSPSLSSRQQQQHGPQLLKAQQHGAQLLKAKQSLGNRERWHVVGANRAADNTVLTRAETDGGLSAQGRESATLTQQQQQQQLQEQEHRKSPIGVAKAAEAGKEVSEAWVI